MNMLLSLAALFAVMPCLAASKIEHWKVGNIIVSDPTIRFRLDIYSPTKHGSYPVLIFLTGLSGTFPATYYTILATAIAEQNVILIGIAKIENIKPEKLAVHLSDFLQWVIKPNDGVARLFAEHRGTKAVKPDVEQLGFLSHSSAAHPLGQYLNSTCGPLKLIVMMNPVDGIDPFGIIRDFVTHPPTPLPFQMPTLIISAGLDSVSVAKEIPPCASNNISNDRWYRSLYGPTFLVNFTDYGHGDNLDYPYYEAVKFLCTPCKGASCDLQQFKIDEGTLITTFVHAIFNRDVQKLQSVLNPRSIVKSNVANKYDLHGYDYASGGPGGFCKHD